MLKQALIWQKLLKQVWQKKYPRFGTMTLKRNHLLNSPKFPLGLFLHPTIVFAVAEYFPQVLGSDLSSPHTPSLCQWSLTSPAVKTNSKRFISVPFN